MADFQLFFMHLLIWNNAIYRIKTFCLVRILWLKFAKNECRIGFFSTSSFSRDFKSSHLAHSFDLDETSNMSSLKNQATAAAVPALSKKKARLPLPMCAYITGAKWLIFNIFLREQFIPEKGRAFSSRKAF